LGESELGGCGVPKGGGSEEREGTDGHREGGEEEGGVEERCQGDKEIDGGDNEVVFWRAFYNQRGGGGGWKEGEGRKGRR
jgi:hypothetical protein